MTAKSFRLFAGGVALAAIASFVAPAMAADSVNIYSYRQPDLMKPVLDAFTAETGIATELLFLDKGLEERIAAEGANSPADVLLATDISRLALAAEKDIVQSVDDPGLAAAIPAEYRDPAGKWFGVTRRARVVYVSKDRVKDEAIAWSDLADPKWKGRVCMRSAQHDYNLALVAAMIGHWGEAKTGEFLTGLKANLTRKPDGNDRGQAKAIFSGECDIGLGNTYYVGLMANNEKEPEQKDWANAIRVVFPTFENGLAHVNLSGMAMAKNAPHKQAALKLMQFLAGPKAQEIYAAQVYEYPVAAGAKPSDFVAGLGELKADDQPLAAIAANRKAASELIDRVGVDDGPGS